LSRAAHAAIPNATGAGGAQRGAGNPVPAPAWIAPDHLSQSAYDTARANGATPYEARRIATRNTTVSSRISQAQDVGIGHVDCVGCVTTNARTNPRTGKYERGAGAACAGTEIARVKVTNASGQVHYLAGRDISHLKTIGGRALGVQSVKVTGGASGISLPYGHRWIRPDDHGWIRGADNSGYHIPIPEDDKLPTLFGVEIKPSHDLYQIACEQRNTPAKPKRTRGKRSEQSLAEKKARQRAKREAKYAANNNN